MENIAKALVKAQLEMITPKKGSVNPFFKNKYADLNDVLAAVVPSLNNNGIVLLQPLVNIEGKNFVKTVLMHESGEIFESLAEIFCKNTNDAQAYGSGVTYARRYSLSSIVGIGSEDDDAQKAVQAKPMATAEILAKAKATNATMAQIKTKYSVTAEQEKNY
jgi:hypothetical protein